MHFNDTDFCGYGVMRAPASQPKEKWALTKAAFSLRSHWAAATGWLVLVLMLAVGLALALAWLGSTAGRDPH